MSINTIKTALENLQTCTSWSIQLLNVKISKRTGVGYSSRQITLSPTNKLNTLLNDIADVYLGDDKKKLKKYQDVRDYDGTADALTIYKLTTENELIVTEYGDLTQAIANPDTENDPFEYRSAYLLKGEIVMLGNNIPVKLVSMQNPVTTLKHKFLCNGGTFEELSQQVLSLRPVMDIIIIGNTVYFLTLAGENLFNMSRSYKMVCHKQVEAVEHTQIIYGIEQFKSIAESGHNPRRFVSFNPRRLHALKRKSKRIEMARQFSIPLDESGNKFDATVEGSAVKIVKLLCDKGMTDPFEETAVEVDGARKWQ